MRFRDIAILVCNPSVSTVSYVGVGLHTLTEVKISIAMQWIQGTLTQAVLQNAEKCTNA